MNNFGEIIGHERVIKHLQMSIKTGNVSHAYIFVGEEGAGKEMMARTFAKTLQCEGKGINPCCTCKSCMQMDTDNQPDVKVTKKSKVNYTIEDIRVQVTGDIQIKPYAGPYKIYIIPDAHALREDAQNALLKTIEEPPEYAIIILLADNVNSLLPTILSRCVSLNFKPVDKEKMKAYLMKECEISENMAEVSAVFSQGYVGKALKYAKEEEFIEIKNMAVKIAKNIDKFRENELIDSIADIAALKDNINDVIDLLMLWFRDIMIYKSTNDVSLLLFREEKGIIKEQAKKRDYKDIDLAMEAMNLAKSRLKANVHTEGALEMMLLSFIKNN